MNIYFGSFAGYILSFIVLDYKYGGTTAGKEMDRYDLLIILGSMGLGTLALY